MFLFNLFFIFCGINFSPVVQSDSINHALGRSIRPVRLGLFFNAILNSRQDLESFFGQDPLIDQIGQQWISLSHASQELYLFNLRKFDSKDSQRILVDLLEVGSKQQYSDEGKKFLLDLSSTLMYQIDWEIMNFADKEFILKSFGNEILYLLPSSFWSSLNQEQIESILDLNIPSVSRWIKGNLKSYFYSGDQGKNIRNINPPILIDKTFLYDQKSDIIFTHFAERPYSFGFQLGQKKDALSFEMSFSLQDYAIPEYAISIYSSKYSSPIIHKLYFADEEYKSRVIEALKQGISTCSINIEIFTNKRLIRNENYTISVEIFRIISLDF